MIGIQHDVDGYSFVGRRSPAWWPSRQSQAEFYCETCISEADLQEVGKQLLSIRGLGSSAALCVSPDVIERYEFSVPASFPASHVYDWVQQNMESWLNRSSVDSYFDYLPATQGNQTDFILYSAARAQLDRYLQPLRQAQFDIVRVEVPEQSLPRLLSGLVSENSLLADIGSVETRVYSISGGDCHWLGSIKSPVSGRMAHESVEVFRAGIQRFIVSLSRSPANVLLAGRLKAASTAKSWLQPLLPGSNMELLETWGHVSGQALLAASAATR